MDEKSRACKAQLEQSLQSLEEGASQAGQKRCIILSGGVDTCAIVMACRDLGLHLDLAVSVSVSNESGNFEGTDEEFVKELAAACGLELHYLHTSAMELVSNMLPFCVKTLETYDPMDLRNSMVVALALHKAKELGCTQVITGDGADELLGGYSFTWKGEEPTWSQKRQEMCSAWKFSAMKMAVALGMKYFSPYVQPSFKEWALKETDKSDCIGSARIHIKLGDEKVDHVTGKLPLRRAYPDAISAWRRKDPIEVGSGSTCLSRKDFWGPPPDPEVVDKLRKEDHVVIRDAEHLTYYKHFAQTFPDAQDLA
ncbi:hypothetical protein GUITHDRAFT_101654 [Guillardia theta CCMP2712]|uniref:Asparagine synthetase domain-containing protein n=1 Tax=Guillardia theta (strain CCMP2712) TaxID=905079 RepID=L1JWL1_GUITC|nr:hypothetical protein GUITHDRAFT_101654 [Guillardia theta CCMP2712]EKX52483.1 hypothetical protein GUITHDRAFT_101654 [Guillardia theta CCMP2712]|eukprot:XP_005839463.1 hypothetical protein GUITHDRAFT_101654 [Guillardia theta CCMP2712]